MFFSAALVLHFIIKLRFPKGKNIHHISDKFPYLMDCEESSDNDNPHLSSQGI